MTHYAIGLIQKLKMGPDIETYLKLIDKTLAPFGGHFIIHGGEKHLLEGETNTDLIVIEFPERTSAEGWYNSTAYQKIIGYRTRNSEGVVFLVQGVESTHRASDILTYY